MAYRKIVGSCPPARRFHGPVQNPLSPPFMHNSMKSFKDFFEKRIATICNLFGLEFHSVIGSLQNQRDHAKYIGEIARR